MADEIYEGAIGIDLGAISPMVALEARMKINDEQAPHTLALPIMKGPTLKSVRPS